MQEKGIGPVADRDAATDEAIMGLLVEDGGLWAVGEVERMIGNEIAAADGLARLRRGGLVHRCGDFVFATRTALEAANLWGPYSTGRPESAMAAGERSSGKKAPTKAMSLRLSPALAAELAAVARALGMTISEVVREAVSNHIATVRSDGGFQANLREQMEKDRELMERLVE